MNKQSTINKLYNLRDYRSYVRYYKNKLDEMTPLNAISLGEKTSQTYKSYSVVENYITKQNELIEKIKNLENDIKEIESKLNTLDDSEKKLLTTRYIEGNGLKATAYICNYSYWHTSVKIKESLQKLEKLFCDV